MDSKKQLHACHRQRLRERYERDGGISFEQHELLELFLFSALPRVNTNPLAHELLDRFGSLYGVFTAPYEELVKVQGIGGKTAKYIIDSYRGYCAECEAEMRSHPCKSFECASNLLMWHVRHREPSADAVVVLLDGDFNVCDVVDAPISNMEETLSRGKAEDAEKVIIGFVGEDKPNVTDTVKASDLTLCDLIRIGEFDAVSVLGETKE